MSATAASPPPASTPTQHDVTPILLRCCTVCHGTREKEAELDLRSRASMLKGGKSGPAIVPGKPDQSLILKRLRSGEMPPRVKVVEASVKPMTAPEIDVVARWIELGAPGDEAEPDVASTEPDPLVTEKDREFWAFRPPRQVQIPTVRGTELARNPVDLFILEKLERKGLSLAPEAGRAALMRRACLDLTGLPPEPAEVEAFLADRDPDAYERLIDRLLASPRHGERWASHWLDAAGYADSDGKREQDLPRPFAYRYRDYVIRALNGDKPYDRFLLEQIAGDELADYENAPEITREICDNLVATGFLRMAPDPTWASITNFVPDRIDVISDEIDVLASTVLGLTIKCARCHNHKFDPLPQRDYYRLADVLKGAFDEHDWLRSGWHPDISSGKRADRDLPFVTTEERKRWEEHNGAIDREVASLKASLAGQASASGKEAENVKSQIQSLSASKQGEPKIRALWDRGEPSPTYILLRGDYLSPGRLVGPGVPSVLTDGKTPFEAQPPWPGAKKTGRRLALARWLVRPDHPLTARVMVNRIWKHHFGSGIVRTLGNFGKVGAAPTHPELLDWLALEFIRSGWSIKSMHRLLMTSAAYRQGSAVTPEREELDPANSLLSRMPLLRMDAEVLYDTLLLVSGRLDETRYGPADRAEVRGDGLVTPVGTERGWRRGIYVQHERKQIVTLLECFDLPAMNPNCVERRESTVAPQALHLFNDGMVHTLAGRFAARVEEEAGNEPARQVGRVFLIALGRAASAAEMVAGIESLDKLTAQWTQSLAGARSPDAQGAASHALASFCHAVLNSAEFLYID